jgi:hypothetical protein
MFKITGFNGEERDMDRISIYFHIEMPKSFYIENDLSEEDFPNNAWSLCCSQIDEDRETKGLWIDLLNEGMPTCFDLDNDEREMVLKHIQDNGIDFQYGLIL